MRRLLGILTAALLLLATPAGAAVTPDEVLNDPAQEGRARDLGKELRCLVCQNQSIDDSDAPLARDLRQVVRERIVAGDSDGEIRAYLVDRYGDFVLLKPPVKPATYLLWFGPLLVLLLGGTLIVAFARRRPHIVSTAPELSAEERRRVEAVLDADEPDRRA